MTDQETRQHEREEETAFGLAREGASMGVQRSANAVSERKHNPEFLDKLQDADVDTEAYDWIENELGPMFSGSHILGNRDESYAERQDLLNKAAAQIMITEQSPGRLLKENPEINAVMQGVNGTDDPDYLPPVSQQEKRVMREAADVATNKQSLAIDGKGLDALTKITSESQVRRDEEEEARGVTGRIKGVFR